MATFKLTSTTKVGKENCYHYVSDKGVKVSFHAHPTAAWNWIIVEGQQRIATKVISAVLQTRFDKELMKSVEVK